MKVILKNLKKYIIEKIEWNKLPNSNGNIIKENLLKNQYFIF